MDTSINQRTFFKIESSPIPHSVSLEKSNTLSNQEEVSASRVSKNVDMQSIISHHQVTQVADDVGEKSSIGSNKKKKKGKVQIFYCSDFPPCNLSFTRSEHLARHIRKHTGERPFQCHCNRRFSRLDNLRQHAQSIHQNEEIPVDSLALMSSRSQRQIRADKGRAIVNRCRSNTAGSQPGPIREHKRNSWSISSISSVGSAYSASYMRERSIPNSHLIATGEKVGLGCETSGLLDSPNKKQPLSPVGLGTSPLSESIFTSSESMSWKSSPDSISLGCVNFQSFQAPNRRLSFPLPLDDSSLSSRGEHSGLLNGFNSESYSPVTAHIKNSPSTTPSSLKNILCEKNTQNEETNRRRTWHPDNRSSFNYATPQLKTSSFTRGPQTQTSITPTNVLPTVNNLRLPGIESFGPLHRPKTPPPRNFSYPKRDTPSQKLWHTKDHFQGQNAHDKEHGINENINPLELNYRQRPSSCTNEDFDSSQNGNRHSILSSQIKNFSSTDPPESSGLEYSRPLIKIPPIITSHERYFGAGTNQTGSPISTRMAGLQVHSHHETPTNFSRFKNQALPSLIDSTTEHSLSNFQPRNDREISNYSDLSRQDQYMSRSFFSSSFPDRSSTIPYESTFRSQKHLQGDEKRDGHNPISLRLDALVTAATR